MLNLTGKKWNNAGSAVLTYAQDNTARSWDAATGKELFSLEGHTGGVSDALWNDDVPSFQFREHQQDGSGVEGMDAGRRHVAPAALGLVRLQGKDQFPCATAR